jgi:hypothetical protein
VIGKQKQTKGTKMTATLENDTGLVIRSTLPQLVKAWEDSKREIEGAFALLDCARERLHREFGVEHYGFDFGIRGRDSRSTYGYTDTSEKLLAGMKKDAWRILIQRMELRRVLSIKRAAELDKQLETGEGLPEIEEKQILAMLEGTLNSIPQLIEEAVKEVFDWLRPYRSEYVTNQKWEVGRKVIISYAVSRFGSKTWSTNYNREQNIRALDNVFHALDGKGTIKSNRGPLVDAINACPKSVSIEDAATVPVDRGETEYFKFKCFQNQNLHLEFKRMDLVTRLNQVAGGMQLRPAA